MDKNSNNKTETIQLNDNTGESSFSCPEIEPGILINNRYKILEKIGTGGFGIVYRAKDIVLDTILAIKFLNPHLISSSKKFTRVKREINISRKISDERLVKIFSLEKWKNIYFLSMEYVEGRNLKEIVKEKGELSWNEFKDIFLEILGAIKTLHKNKIIHRDIKPSNIIITGDNKIKILDFGLAKEVEDSEKTSDLGEITGSPAFLSPEQARWDKVTESSDIYQLGLLLYNVLSGEPPFSGETSRKIIYQQLYSKPPAPNSKGVKVKNFIKYGIEKALEKKESKRFSNINEMVDFFKNEKINPVKWFTSRKPVKLSLKIIACFLIITFLLFGFFNISDFSNISSVYSKGNILIAKNKFGFKLWEKDFKPFRVYRTILTKPKGISRSQDFLSKMGKTYDEIQNKKIINVFLSKKRQGIFDPKSSIISSEFDNTYILMDNQGKILIKNTFSDFFYLQNYEFVKMYRISKFEQTDIDNDNQKEYILQLRHSLSMYPSAIVILDNLNYYEFVNPGDFIFFKPLKSEGKSPRLMFLGHNNLVAHTRFFSVTEFNKNKARLYGFPNLDYELHYDLNDFLVFLPYTAKLVNENWEKKGFAEFLDYQSGKKITIKKNYSIIIENNNKKSIYKDSKNDLKNVYRLVNSYYQEKTLNDNIKKSYVFINDALSYPVKNPYLKAALLYLKGDLEIDMNMHNKGYKTLNKALNYYPNNIDSAQRICEIYFLKNEYSKSLEYLNNNFSHLHDFWGLSGIGNNLFKGYIHLNMGLFSDAEKAFTKIIRKNSLSEYSLEGIIYLFKGDYDKAYEILKKGNISRRMFMTIQEYRLLFARAMVLAHKDIELADFYFSDISNNSRYKSHLADISKVYLMVLNKNKSDAEKFSISAFEKLLKKSKGDFESKLWLFYDAFVYGKTMEILNNKEQAIRGYKTCIKANPFTELAAKARKSINRLNK